MTEMKREHKKDLEDIKHKHEEDLDEIMSAYVKNIDSIKKDHNISMERLTCGTWHQRFIYDIVNLGESVATMNEIRSPKNQKPKLKNPITSIPLLFKTTIKGMDEDELVGDWLINMRNYFAQNAKISINDTIFIESTYNDLNISIEDGLRCQPSLLYEYLPESSINELRPMLEKYSFPYAVNGKGKSIKEKNNKSELLKPLILKS